MMRKGGAANVLDGSSSLVEPFVLLLVLLFLLFREWYDLNASDCILCLSAGRPECGGLPEDGMCQPRSGHQELLQGAADKNAARLEMFENNLPLSCPSSPPTLRPALLSFTRGQAIVPHDCLFWFVVTVSCPQPTSCCSAVAPAFKWSLCGIRAEAWRWRGGSRFWD